MVNDDELTRALAALDAKVAGAEVRVATAEASLREATAHLTEVLAERRGADALVALLRSGVPDGSTTGAGMRHGQSTAKVPRGFNTGLTGVLEQLVRAGSGQVFTVDDRGQVRNGLHYLARRRDVLESVGRGKWRLRNASAPVAPGAEDSEEPKSGSSWEEGGTDDDSALLRGRDDSAVRPQVVHGHAGLRAPIGG